MAREFPPPKSSLEVIIDAEPQEIGGEAVAGAGYREVAIGVVEIQPLRLRRPVWREADLGAAAGDPAEAGMAFRQVSGGLRSQAAISETGGTVDEHIVDRDTGAAAQRAKPRIGELPRGKGVVGAGENDVGLGAVNKIAVLPVEADLSATGHARRARRIVVHRAPLIAQCRADIGPGPAISERRGCRVVLIGGKI